MAKDLVEPNDTDFIAQTLKMSTWLAATGNAEKGGFAEQEVTDFQTARSLFSGAHGAVVTYETNGQPLYATKNTTRAGAEAEYRGKAAQLRARHKLGKVTDTDLVACGIPLADTSSTPAPTPTTRPLVKIDASQRLEHRVSWADEATPGSTAKPAGTADAELRVAVAAQGTPPPADPEAFDEYQTHDPKTPNIVSYQAADGGKQAHMAMRWRGKNGEYGPWSTVVSATIQA